MPASGKAKPCKDIVSTAPHGVNGSGKGDQIQIKTLIAVWDGLMLLLLERLCNQSRFGVSCAGTRFCIWSAGRTLCRKQQYGSGWGFW